ncbi:50S ribosomal protein L24 [Thermorudis peleae]|uniref:50S ribosomal protein L24 n=1 Tax=Thermorudis peleae TaxID=1382356 RepID=UPI000570A5EA|nr:50S ribosomal protein L24 [Thermorudis peleae]MBX6754014.1 50S ribosomal protein L24 [Thermorudis peleae]
MAEKIVTGDEVIVIRGKDKGARGRVRQNLPREDRVIVEGVNLVKRHRRATPGVQQAGIVEMEAPLHVSKVMLICPHCGKPTRVGFRFTESGEKVRYCKKCQATIEKPTATRSRGK